MALSLYGGDFAPGELIDPSGWEITGVTTDAEASYTATSAADQTTYMFQANDGDQYSNGAAANTLS